jgi:transcriptional regulator with XRE-family HTH domain
VIGSLNLHIFVKKQMDKNSLIAVKIKDIRGKKNILQKEIAKSLGLGENAYSRIEGGHTQITINNLYKIAESLDTPVEQLLSIKATNIANNNNNVVMTQFNEGTVTIQFSAKEFTEIYDKINSKK